MLESSEAFVCALAIGEFASDRVLLQDIFTAAGWRLFVASDRRRAMQVLETHPIQVVLAESELPNWNWKKVLHDLRRLAQPPQLVVASRTADDYLWSEVLNLGGYDVLPQPLEREEAERVIAAAARHFSRPPIRSAQTSVTAPAIVA